MEKASVRLGNMQVAELKLVYKSMVRASEREKINSSRKAYEIFLQYWNEEHIELLEEAKVLLLNRANKVLGIYELSIGGSTGTIVDPRVVFSVALKANACAIILAHNHPSSNLKPSQADMALTRRIRQGGELLEIQLLDHLIVTPEGYYSFADEGAL